MKRIKIIFNRFKKRAKKGYFLCLNSLKKGNNEKNWSFSSKKFFYIGSFLIVMGTIFFIFASHETDSPMVFSEGIDFNDESDAFLFTQLDDYIEFQDFLATQELSSSSNSGKTFELKQLNVKNYTVKKGETLGGIARKFNLNLGTLISYNNIRDVRKVRAGSELQIPSANGILYTVGRGDSLEGIANRHKSDFNLICDYNNISSDVIHIGQKLFLPGVQIDNYALDRALGRLFLAPTVGRLTSPYGYRRDPFTGLRRMHNGVDIANRVGTLIIASMAGKVVYIDNRPKGYGKYVVLKHAGGYQTLYAHLNTISVKQGAWVEQGVKIGSMGSTGRSTGSHLHFTIFKNNRTLNPLNFIHY